MSATTDQAKAHTSSKGTQIQAVSQDNRESSIVGADHERILLSTRVLRKNSIFGLYDLGPVNHETATPKEINLMVGPISAALAIAVELILVALLVHKQVDEFAYRGVGPNIEFDYLRR